MAEPPAPKVKRAHITSPSLAIPASDQRAAIREAYRLRPDLRFLLAIGEIRRLATGKPGPPGVPATASFRDGKWTVRIGDAELGTLPELPDFPDYLALLVRYAKSSVPKATSGRRSAASGGHDAFLMPGVASELTSGDSASESLSIPDAARCLARITFQMEDRLEISPLIPARALALLAAARARDGRAAVEEEILLAHVLGYTRHAEALAKSSPESSSLRLFETRGDDALAKMASASGASEETRYLALRRAADHGDLSSWKDARARLFPGNDSPSIIATGLLLPLPHEVEVTEERELIAEALPREVLRELQNPTAPEPQGSEERSFAFDSALSHASANAHGRIWDGPALEAYYSAIYLAPAVEMHGSFGIPSGPGAKLIAALSDKPDSTPEGDSGAGAPLRIENLERNLRAGQIAEPQIGPSIQALVRRLDSRPTHRARVAWLLHYYLLDPLASESLHRSLLQVLGDGSVKAKAESALYVGDWATLDRLVGSPQTGAEEAAGILWTWYGSKTELDRLDRQYARLIERFPGEWDCTSYYVDFLRSQGNYRKACEVGELWLRRNTDPRTPGYFHAHIRLAHSYALAHEFEKGRALLEAMTESESFQQTIRSRGLAECLAGLGQFAEADARIRDVLRWNRLDPENIEDFVRILWREGKNDDAADALIAPENHLKQDDQCRILTEDLPDIFAPAPATKLEDAVDAIVKRPALAGLYRCGGAGFAKAGRWEEAFLVSSRFPPGPEKMDRLIQLYEYRKSWKGREDAADWLKAQIPPGQLNPLSMKALYSKNDDLLWDVIVTPEPNNHPEWVWLFRADAFALRGGADSHRTALLGYFGEDGPDPYRAMGRYLIGLKSEQDLLALATTPERLSEVAYYLGARAQGEKRFRDACEWYRVSMETHQNTMTRSLAAYALSEWARTGQGIWKLEAESSSAAAISTAPSRTPR